MNDNQYLKNYEGLLSTTSLALDWVAKQPSPKKQQQQQQQQKTNKQTNKQEQLSDFVSFIYVLTWCAKKGNHHFLG